MKLQQTTLKDLQAALDDMSERHSSLPMDDLFVAWFLRAYVTESEDAAVKAVSGGARDKGIDALLIDDAAMTVFVVQAKFRKKLSETREKRADVVSFVEVAQRLSEPDDETFADFLKTTEGYVAELLREARKRVLKRGYRASLYFVTLGTVTKSIRNDADSLVRKAGCAATIEVIDGKRAMLIFRDYLDGVAPPIPTLQLEMEKDPGVTVNGVSQRYDEHNKIESWVFSMRGDAIASLYEYAGVRLFARNIRGFLGESMAVNQSMTATLEGEPGRFFYYNNGITILCDEAEKKDRRGASVLQVSNPQVINGQQTTRTLAAHPKMARYASVLVKVVVVPRGDGDSADGFESLVSRIVAGTNWQNAIAPSDLMSNDRIQIELERALRKLGYAYIRKRQKKGEARKMAGGKHLRFIKKEEFAQAVAACDIDPVVARTSREALFKEALYGKVFPSSDPGFYLSRHWLLAAVRRRAWGNKQRREPRWLVLYFVWSHLASAVRSRSKARAFRVQCERQTPELMTHLNRAIDRVFIDVLKYFRQNRGKGADAVEASAFFKSKRGSAKAFLDFWKGNDRGAALFEKHLAKVVAAIDGFNG